MRIAELTIARIEFPDQSLCSTPLSAEIEWLRLFSKEVENLGPQALKFKCEESIELHRKLYTL